MTCKLLPTNKCLLQMLRSCVIQLKPRSCVKMAVRFPELSESDLIVGNCEQKTQSSNDKAIIELGCRKIS